MFPAQSLPLHTQQLLSTPQGFEELKTWPQYRDSAVSGDGWGAIQVNVFEFFVLWMACYVVKGSRSGDQVISRADSSQRSPLNLNVRALGNSLGYGTPTQAAATSKSCRPSPVCGLRPMSEDLIPGASFPVVALSLSTKAYRHFPVWPVLKVASLVSPLPYTKAFGVLVPGQALSIFPFGSGVSLHSLSSLCRLLPH